ncbi:transcriptional regulator [Nocardia nova]|uniref:excisionase family DNA-binding protein n=1 Tax=Nocardia nova TaxID=37330 RepID=UPI000CEA658C|nr:transcriptional regulator [Nocardia nova]
MSARFMTVQEAADVLCVSKWMVYRLLWDGQVQSVTVGRCRRIVRASFEEYVAGLIDSAAAA